MNTSAAHRPPPSAGHDELRELVSVLWGSKWRILFVAAAFAITAFLVSSLMRPVYRAEAIVSLVTEPSGGSGMSALMGQFEGLANLAGVNVNAGVGAEQMGILRSRLLAEQFIREQGISGTLMGGKVASNSDSEGDAYETFDKDVRSIRDDPESGLVKVRFDWHERERVADWVNEYVKLANQVVRNRAIKQAELRLAYLEAAVGQTSSIELTQAFYRIIESEVKAKMLASIDAEIAFRVVDPAVMPPLHDVVRPRPLLVAVIAFIVGSLLSMTFIYSKKVILSSGRFACE